MPDKKISDLVDGDPLQPTDEFVVARAGDNFKIDGAAVVAAVTKHDVTLAGNTVGVLALISSGTMTLAGGNNITLSQAGNAITISGANTAAETQTAISGIANSQTTYTSGTVSLSELGAITIRSTTGNQFQFSVNAQTAQTGISGIANSQTTYTSGTVTFSELGAITIRSTTGNQYQFSVNSQTVQTQGILSAGVSTGGNTAGNTTVNTGSRFVIVASGNATASQATAAGASTVTISVGTQTVQTQGVLSAGVSTGGNTSGDTTVNTGSRLVFAGGNNITLSQGTAAGATTITISAGAGGGATFSGGMSTMGNTSGDTGYATNRLNLVGGNNITLSGSTNGGSMTITVSAPTGTGGNSIGVSTGGNTAGSTGVTGTRYVLVGTNAISLSQSTDANGGTVSIAAPITTLTSYNAYQGNPLVAAGAGNGTMIVQPYALKANIQFDRVVLPIRISNASNSSFSQTLSIAVGVYTKNASTLSLVSSTTFSTNFTASGTVGSYSLYGGPRNVTIGLTGTLTQGNYYIGVASRTTTGGGAGATYEGFQVSQVNSNYSGVLGVASNATNQFTLGLGRYTATTTLAPGSIGFSQIEGTGSAQMRPPSIYFHSGTV